MPHHSIDATTALRAIGRRTTLDGASLALDQCRDAIALDTGVSLSEADVRDIVDPLIPARLAWTRSGRLTIVSVRDPALA